MGTLLGARPKWNRAGRPSGVTKEPRGLEAEVSGIKADQDVEVRGAPAPSLPLFRRNVQEVEGVTPPRRYVQDHGGLRIPDSRLPPRGTRVTPQIFTEPRSEDRSLDRRNVPWSPENILVDTVARLQQDLEDIRAESRQFRRPGVPLVVPTPRQAAYATTKVLRFGGTTSWEQYRQVFDAIVLSNGWNDATAALQLCFKCSPASFDVSSDTEDRAGGCAIGPLWIAGQTGRL